MQTDSNPKLLAVLSVDMSLASSSHVRALDDTYIPLFDFQTP